MARFRSVALLFTALTALGLLAMLGCNTGSGQSGNTAPLGPNVISTAPVNGTARVATTANVFTVTFDTEMQAASFRTNNRPNVTVTARMGGVNFVFVDNAITIAPLTGATRNMTITLLQTTFELPYSCLMTVTLNTNIRTFDILNPASATTGIPLPSNFSFQFTTEHDTVLLNEICTVNPQGGVGIADFVEVINPTADTITLTNYWLTDATDATVSRRYFNINRQPSGASRVNTTPAVPAATNTTNLDPGGGLNGDFLVKFPNATTILPGQVIVVAMDGTDFINSSNFPSVTPNFEVRATSAIPDMTAFTIAGGGTFNGPLNDRPSVDASPNLDPNGETVILFFYDRDGATRVEDVDYVVWDNNNLALGVRTTKNQVQQDGGGQIAGTPAAYRTETLEVNQRPVTFDGAAAGQVHLAGNSMTRVGPFEMDARNGNPVNNLNMELFSGGNGISLANKVATGLATGKVRTDPNAITAGVATPFGAALQFGGVADERHDEMSEPLNLTWSSTTRATPGQ